VTFDSECGVTRQESTGNSELDQKTILQGEICNVPKDQGTFVPSIALQLPTEALSTQTCEPRDAAITPATPALTPNALTEAALEKSEKLLAELNSLGLQTEENDDDADVNADYAASRRGTSMTISRATSVHSLPSRCSTPKHKDTVEMPRQVLKLLLECWADSHHESLQESSCSEPEPEVVSSAPCSQLDSPSTPSSATERLRMPLLKPTLGGIRQCQNQPLHGLPALRIQQLPANVLHQSFVPARRNALTSSVIRCTLQQTINISTTFRVSLPL
jgi:hypothetical protein